MKKRLLFVDDEPKILQGLKRMLYNKQDEWDMVFAPGGEQALEELKKAHYDVIVSDMRMPKIDGATLLKAVQDHYPHIVRIVLSGYAEMETALRAVPVAHQFLSKPCEAKRLEEVVERACQLQALLNDELLKNEVGKIANLPALPKTYHALTKALSQPDTSLKDVGAIVEQDMAISAKVLQLVNSAFFGLPRRVTSVMAAVTYIGMNMLKNLALTVEVFRAFQGKKDFQQNFSLEALQNHALLTANLAKKMFNEPQKSEDAFITGMLHEVGKLILMNYLPEKFVMVLKEVNTTGKEWHIVEGELFGITHAEIGAYLLGIWGLPYPVVEAVANHHEPRRVQHQEFGVLSAVYIANQLIEYADHPSTQTIDTQYMQDMGVLEKLTEWQGYLADIKANCQKEGQ